MMLPDPRSIISGANARVIRNTPLMLVSITSRHAPGSVSQNGRGSVMNRSLTNRMPRAALLTRMSGAGRRAASRSTSASLVTSATTAVIRPGRSRASAAVRSASSGFLAAVMITCAPSRA